MFKEVCIYRINNKQKKISKIKLWQAYINVYVI